MCWWWRKVRKAEIDVTDRDQFESIGEEIVRMSVAGYKPPNLPPELSALFIDPTKKRHAIAWLTEQADSHERRENRLETVEWAILIFVGLSLVIEVMQLFHIDFLSLFG